MAVVYESVASSTTNVCARPSGTVAGDFLVASMYADSAPASLSGWTLRADVVSADIPSFRFCVLTKEAGGSEPVSYTFPVHTFGVSILRLSGVDTTSPIDGTPTSIGSFDTAQVLGSITTTVDDAMLIAGTISGSISTTAAGMTKRAAEDAFSGIVFTNVWTEPRATAGATGTRTVSDGSGVYASSLIAIKAAIASTPAEVDPPTAAADAEAITPSIHAAAVVAVTAATATASAIAPVVQSENLTVVLVPVATATANTLTPVARADALVALSAATATATADAPSVGVSRSVVAPAANASADALTVAVGAEAVIDVPVTGAAATALAPVIDAERKVIVLAPRATATAAAFDPSLAADALIAGIAADANAAAFAPSVGVFSTLVAPSATATADANAAPATGGALVVALAAAAQSAAFPVMAGQTYTGSAWSSGSYVRAGTMAEHAATLTARPAPTGTVRMRPGHHGRSEAR